MFLIHVHVYVHVCIYKKIYCRSKDTCSCSLTLLTLIHRDDPLHESVHDHLVIIGEAGCGGRPRVRVDVFVQPQGGTAGGCATRTNTLDLVVPSLQKDIAIIETLGHQYHQE